MVDPIDGMRSALLVPLLALLACDAPGDAWAWSHYAADAGSTRYAPLDQVDAGNFARLRVAWTWQSADVAWKRAIDARPEGEDPPFAYSDKMDISEFQLTPIVVDGVLYGVTTVGQLFALDAATGRELWVHDPQAWRESQSAWDFLWPKQRGVAWWEGRIFLPTYDAYLVAVDAATGEPIAEFGEGGRVDLLAGLRGPPVRRLGDYFQTSPAVVAGDTVIVGGSVTDRPKGPRSTPGDVRGYDARSGRLKWTFHVVPAAGEPGTDTWEDGAWRVAGGANAWGPMTVDPETGRVYLVTTTPTNDLYGGHRLGDNLYAESLVCLDGETGERIWHYQLVRHGLWDYDPSASPILVDLRIDGRPVAAVAQATKQGFVFVFDRATGEPVWPIEDRPVPASDVPGERASPTQPFPTKPPPYERQGIGEDDLADFTPAIRERALAVFRRFRSGPMFLPPSLEGSLVLPGASGGTSWRGAAVDVETGVLYVPSITLPNVYVVEPGDPEKTSFRYTGTSLVYDLDGRSFGSRSLPFVKPPYSRITAIDLNAGEIRWQVPNGNGPRDHPDLADLDLPPLGSGVPTGVFVTKTLVVASDGADYWFPGLGEPILRAYDKATGAVVGEVPLPAKVRGVPMTYEHDGVQYLVVTVSNKRPAADPLRVEPPLGALALPR
ncbi:MAG: pyrroloquinoline quinone-dependent dehydrogenase [Myxococcota bacterium]